MRGAWHRASPFLSRVPQKLQVTGSVPTATGTKVVVPDGASGVVMNVTPVGATQDGFISVEPGDAVGLPTTSSLNFTAGAINPNTVTVAIPTAGADKGKVRLTYDAFGQVGPFTDILVDVIGYTTNAGLVELANRVRAIETASNVIPPGVTVTGNILWDESVIADNADTNYFVPFPANAPADPGGAKVNFAPDSTGATQDDDPQCTGSVTAPTAPAAKCASTDPTT